MPPQQDARFELFIEVTKAQVEAIKENTRELQSIKEELRSQSTIYARQEEKLNEINKHFTNGFKSDIVEHISETGDKISKTENKMLEKISGLSTNLKIQWTLLLLGLIPLLGYVIKDIAEKN